MLKKEPKYLTKVVVHIAVLLNLILIAVFLNIMNLKTFYKIIKSNNIRYLFHVQHYYIFKCHDKIRRFLRIKKCLIYSSSLFLTLKIFHNSPKLFIGAEYNGAFESHSWVECDSNKYYFDDNQNLKKVLEIM